MNIVANLFVYGTLMYNIQSAMARFLQANSEFLGEAWLPGRLYDLGQYPGVIYDAHANTKVYGHVFRLYNANQVFAVLDPYEGIDPNNIQRSEYCRALVFIDFQGIKQECWVYLYNYSTEDLIEIPNGNYLDYIQNNPAHQRFIKEGR